MTDDEGIDWDAINQDMGDSLSDDMLQYAVTPTQLRNRIVRDIVPDEQIPTVCRMLGIHPSSPDVETMENREMHARLGKAVPLQQAVGMMSSFSAEAVAAAILDATGEPVMGNTMAETATKLQPAIFMSTMAMLAELLDAGYVHLPHIQIVRVGGEQ